MNARINLGMVYLTSYVLFSFVFSISAAVDSCRDLDIYESSTTEPISGNALPYCATDELQCCTIDYITTLSEQVSKQLLIHAQNDLERNLKVWSTGYRSSLESLGQFVVLFVENLPFPPNLIHLASAQLSTFEDQLFQWLNPDSSPINVNFSEALTNLTSNLIDLFTTAIPASHEAKQCLNNLLRDNISPDVVAKIGTDLQQLQLLYQTLKKLDMFVSNLHIEESFGYHPQDQCIQAILSQQCLSCQRNLPSLCTGVCSNIVIGCQSSISDGLLPQFEGLWEVVNNVIQLTFSTVNKTLRIDEPMLLTNTILTEVLIPESQSQCNIDLVQLLFSGRKRRNTNIMLPVSISFTVDVLSTLSGVFQYGDTIPSYCVSNTTTPSCWNGSAIVDSNEAFLLHVGSSIANQSQNPTYQFNTYDLYRQAASLRTPVVDFLVSSDFTSTLPNNIVLPHIDPLPTPTPKPTPTPTHIAETTVIPSRTPTSRQPTPTRVATDLFNSSAAPSASLITSIVAALMATISLAMLQ